MIPIYKKVKIAMPHCPKCGEQLSGDNNYYRPWNCKCGEWEAELEYPPTGEYNVKIKDTQQ